VQGNALDLRAVQGNALDLRAVQGNALPAVFKAVLKPVECDFNFTDFLLFSEYQVLRKLKVQ
jgi:hypothetical protein